MQNPEEPNAEQEPNAEHHVAKFLVEVLILKRKLMAFSCHIQLSWVPPQCVMLWRSPEMNFTRRPRVAKLLCIGSPLNRSRDITYCNSSSHIGQTPPLVVFNNHILNLLAQSLKYIWISVMRRGEEEESNILVVG